MNIAIIVFICLLSLFAIFLIIGGYIGFSIAVSRTPPRFEKKSVQTPQQVERGKVRKVNNANFMAENPEDMTLVNSAGFSLKGWFLPPKDGCKRIVIAVHGYRCNGLDEFAHFMPFYHKELGYGYFLPDLRSHGRSEGKYVGFGAPDSRDIREWIDYFIKRYNGDVEFILHGISMGAATVMLVNESNPPEQVKAVVEDCGFTSAKEIIVNTFKNDVGFSFPPLIAAAQFYIRLFAGYRLSEADCLGKIEKAKCPMLFVHGTGDTFVPFEMGERLYAMCSVPKDFLWVKDAVHAFSYYDARDEYNEKLRAFISKYLDGVTDTPTQEETPEKDETPAQEEAQKQEETPAQEAAV